MDKKPAGRRGLCPGLLVLEQLEDIPAAAPEDRLDHQQQERPPPTPFTIWTPATAMSW